MFGFIGDAIGRTSGLFKNIISGDWSTLGMTSAEQKADSLNQQALDFERERDAYGRQLQERMFEREDNAVQRRVADLKAAGMSPVLAAGQGANAGQEIGARGDPAGAMRAQAEMHLARQDRMINMSNAVMNMIKGVKEIQHTKAQTDAIKFEMGEKFQHEKSVSKKKLDLQELDQKARASLMEFQKGKLSADTVLTKLRAEGVPAENAQRIIDAVKKGHDVKTSIRFGLRSSDHFSVGVRDVAGILNMFGSGSDGYIPGIDRELQKLLSKALGQVDEVYTPLDGKDIDDMYGRNSDTSHKGANLGNNVHKLP